MGYYSDLDIDRQEAEARGEIVPEPCLEPDTDDITEYQRQCMADKEFAKEMDLLTRSIIKDIGGV